MQRAKRIAAFLLIIVLATMMFTGCRTILSKTGEHDSATSSKDTQKLEEDAISVVVRGYVTDSFKLDQGCLEKVVPQSGLYQNLETVLGENTFEEKLVEKYKSLGYEEKEASDLAKKIVELHNESAEEIDVNCKNFDINEDVATVDVEYKLPDISHLDITKVVEDPTEFLDEATRVKYSVELLEAADDNAKKEIITRKYAYDWVMQNLTNEKGGNPQTVNYTISLKKDGSKWLVESEQKLED